MDDEKGPEDLGNGWYQYEDEEGRFYYYNTITENTQWDPPTEEELEPPPDEGPDGSDPYAEYYSEVHDSALNGEDSQVVDAVADLHLGTPVDTDQTSPDDGVYPEDAAALYMQECEDEEEDAEQDENDSLQAESESEEERDDEDRGGVLTSLSSNSAGGMGSQFAEAMAMLRQQGIFNDPSNNSEATQMKNSVGRGTGVTRYDSQFYQSMNALKSQGFDAPGTISRVLPKSVFQRTQNFESNSNYVSSDPFMRPSVDTPDQEASGVYLSPQIAAIAQNEVGDDEPEPDTQQEPSGEAVQVAAEDAEAAGPSALEKVAVADEEHPLVAEAPASHDISNGLWTTVTFQAVVFVWYETSGSSRTEPLFPGTDGSLQVGPILVAWEGLSMYGPSCQTTTLIPYENIVMWTLHLEETCLDLTLDGTFLYARCCSRILCGVGFHTFFAKGQVTAGTGNQSSWTNQCGLCTVVIFHCLNR